MKLVRTAKIVLDAPATAFSATLTAYTKAYNLVCKTGWDDKDTNGVSLHHKTYKATRENFGLPSQLAISARTKATESLKSVATKIKEGGNATCPQSECSIRYDANSYTLMPDCSQVSIKTVEGRLKFKTIFPDYFKQYLGWRWTTSELFVRNDKVFLHIVFEKEIEDVPASGKTIGIDRGINQLAVTSENQFFSGQSIKRISKRYETLRSELQSKGHSGKRHFRKVSAKERRFRRNVNHLVAKQIIASTPSGSTIVLENLKGIRQAKRRKEQQREAHKWNFYQLEEFLTYKGMAKGIKIEHTPARYTSQKCSVCGHTAKSNRRCQSLFHCVNCGFRLNADLNASRNIRNNYLDAISHPSRATVNPPSRCSFGTPAGSVEQAPRSSAEG